MTVQVRLLGRPQVHLDGRPAAVQPRGRKAWAVLARCVLADRAPTRAELAAELFEAAADPMAALRWSLADMRRALGRPGDLRGDPVAVRDADVFFDVRGLESGDVATAEVGGVLLDGIELDHCPAFDAWLLLARAHWAARSREELRLRALRALGVGDTAAAVAAAERAVALDFFDDAAQELYVRALVADGSAPVAAGHVRLCTATYRDAGLDPPDLHTAARERPARPPGGVRARIAAGSLLRAGTAALDAGAADAGVETLRRAAADATRADDAALHAQVLLALGAALVHAVRGHDGEGAVVLHRAVVLARTASRADLAAEALRELAFTDVQAGRHRSAARALDAAEREAAGLDDPALTAGLLAIQGMNEADRGRHATAIPLLSESARTAASAQHPRQEAWSLGVLARSLLLNGQIGAAREAATASMLRAQAVRWTAFLPWPQTLFAECELTDGRVQEARDQVEEAFTVAVELSDPCWEGMAARMLSLVSSRTGDTGAALSWITEARQRCDRVSDRYVWVSAYIGLAHLDLLAGVDRRRSVAFADRLQQEALRADLPEFHAWALAHRAASGDEHALRMARAAAGPVDNPALHARLDALQALQALPGRAS